MNAKWKLKKACAGRPQEPGRRTLNPDRDPEHLEWIRSQPCALITFPLPGATKCYGETEAHHPRLNTGAKLKEPDRRAIPLCRRHHTGELHRLAGTFRNWTKVRLKAWQRTLSDVYERLGKEQRAKVPAASWGQFDHGKRRANG